MVIEFGEQDSSAFDEVMEVLKRYLGFGHVGLRDETMVSLPGGLRFRPQENIPGSS